MEFCDAREKLLEQLGNTAMEDLTYGMETNFDCYGGLIGACEQVREETDLSSFSYILPDEIYTLDQDNYLNVQNTEEIVTDNSKENLVDDNPNVDSFSANLHSCEVGDVKFNVKINLQCHMSIHQNDHSHFCNFCGVNFPLKNDLLNHLKVHAYICDKKTGDSNSIEEPKVIKNCANCDNNFDEDKFDNHICAVNIISSGDEKSSDNDYLSGYSCKICNKDFKNKTRLTRHLLSHRKKMSCNICNQKFTNQHDLINHYTLHKKTSNGEKVFECKECGKIFASRSSQQIHARVHSGERPYGCNFCDRAFADGGTLRKHERIHTGEKPYVCLICTRAFNQRVVLRDHIKSHHINVDPNYARTSNPYHCKICNHSFTTPDEIHNDIVKHCDEDTQRRRKPPVGPRKYKKRTISKSQGDENINSMKEKAEQSEGDKKKRGRKSKLEKHVLTEDWKNTVFSKSKTGSEDPSKSRIFSGGEINRPRTKNVSRPINDNFRFVPARFPDPKVEFEEISAAVDSIKVKVEAFDRSETEANDFGKRLRRKVNEEIY